MPKKITQKTFPPKLERKKRVAAYARVSTAKDTMLHSLSAQVGYYKTLIQKEDSWQFVGVYADEAMTGTKDTRADFQRMLADCRSGKVDMIITKSISRFARNTVTLLETVRMLKALEVDIYFEEQNIHTMSADGELTARLQECTEERDRRNDRDRELRIFISALEKRPLVIEEWDVELWITFLNTATVHKDGSITFHFRDGTELTIQNEACSIGG